MDCCAVEAARSRASDRRRVSRRGITRNFDASRGVWSFRSSWISFKYSIYQYLVCTFSPAAAINCTTILTFVLVMQNLELRDCQVP